MIVENMVQVAFVQHLGSPGACSISGVTLHQEKYTCLERARETREQPEQPETSPPFLSLCGCSTSARECSGSFPEQVQLPRPCPVFLAFRTHTMYKKTEICIIIQLATTKYARLEQKIPIHHGNELRARAHVYAHDCTRVQAPDHHDIRAN